MIEIYIKKNVPVFVIRMRVGDLDKNKLSNKFLSHNITDNEEVFVKCDEQGNLDLRGKNQEYRTYKIND